MAVGKKKAIRDFTQGNPTKELLMFSLPIACTLILQSFYNMADTLIIGTLSSGFSPAESSTLLAA